MCMNVRACEIELVISCLRVLGCVLCVCVCVAIFHVPNISTISLLLCSNGLIVPYSKGNITFSVLSPEPQPRPGYNEFYKTPELGQFVLASQVRVRLQDHYYVKQPRHKYYGIYEFIVTGR